MNSLELITTTEPNFIPVVRKYHSQNNHSKNEPIDSNEKLNPDYTEIVSNNADDTIDVREVIITNNNNHSRITESKCGKHDKKMKKKFTSKKIGLRQEIKQQKKTASSHMHLLLAIE